MFNRQNKTKEAFERVRQDILFLQSEIEYLRYEINDIKGMLRQIINSLDSLKPPRADFPKSPPGLQDMLRYNNFKVRYSPPYDKNKKEYSD